MASDADDGGGFVLNLAGVDDGASRDEPERRGNPMRRTVMRAPRKGRHRGWAGKKPGASEARGGGRGRGAGRGGRGAPPAAGARPRGVGARGRALGASGPGRVVPGTAAAAAGPSSGPPRRDDDPFARGVARG